MAKNEGNLLTTSVALMLAAGPALAGGIERSPQSIAPIFEPGRYLEIGLSHVNPTVSGYDLIPGNPGTGDVANSYTAWTLAYKQDLTPNLSAAIIVDTPFGADTFYPASRSIMLGGTYAKVETTSVTGILRWHNDSGFGVHGGVRMLRSDASVGLNGMAYGGVSGYSVRFDRDTSWGWLLGASYEVPDIAARVALTFNSSIKHDFRTTQDFSATMAGAAYDLTTVINQTEVRTPRSWNLDFQTGIAEDTLLFGSIRWVKWSEFRVDPEPFTTITGDGLVDLEDSTTLTLGIGRKFTDQWSGSASFTFEKRGKDLVSPLAPVSGRRGITLAAIHTRDNIKLTTGINYTWLGDAKPETGTPDVARAQMKDNHALSVGMRLGISF